MRRIRFTVQLKILSITVLIVSALLAFVIVVHGRIHSLQQATNSITQQDREMTNLTNQLEKNILDMETGQRGYVITGQDKYLAPYRQGQASLDSNYDQLAALTNAGALQLNRLHSIKENVDRWIAATGDPVIQLKKEGQDAQILKIFNTDAGIDQMDRIRSQISGYRVTMNENTNLLIDKQADRNQFLLQILYIVWFLIAAAGISASWIIAHSISATVRKITGTLTALVRTGDLNTRLTMTTNDEVSDLGHATNQLLNSQQEREWFQERANGLMEGYQGVTTIAKLGDIFLSKTAEMIGYPYGTLYIRSQECGEDYLTRSAVFAGSNVDTEQERILYGEGLIGQCAKEGHTLNIAPLPENYIHIRSGLGASSPQHLLLLPVSFLGEVVAVVEIASFAPLTLANITFLESVAAQFGAAIVSTVSSMRIDRLLEESQRQNEELQVYSEELQTQSEELHIQAESLLITNKKLEDQNAIAEQKSREAQDAREELTQYAEMLKRSTQYKSEFLANMSHELRTPLNGIMLLSEFLMENPSGSLNAEELEFTQAIHSSGQDLLALINDILDLSKVEAGKMDITMEEVNISEIPESASLHFGQLSQKKSIPLQVKLSDELPDILYTDPHRLRQIIINLLSNAFKFTAQGTVTLEIRMVSAEELLELQGIAAGPCIVFSVTDTGIGIAKNKQGLIFNAFQQAEGDTERKYGGTGLGLSISKELTELLGGQLKLVSAEGAGSTFSVYLPVHQEQKKDEQVTAEVYTSVDLDKSIDDIETQDNHNPLFSKRVLLVDDDERNLYALTTILSQKGLDITAAHNGEDALKALQNSASFDLILMDIMMPVMNGYETIKQIKELHGHQDVPIIALTAKAMQEDRERVIMAGATEYLSKPINMDQLLALMQMLITDK
ncbi:CHASE3 domain-containing protein [Paenibacillus sp. FSL M7-0420]|uniref:CHASE3 domain-containing protein n=1 Tax=Paenibacillus sp. FSL M7-0420 TaxID=2921609 RepID=UPI0030F5782B